MTISISLVNVPIMDLWKNKEVDETDFRGVSSLKMVLKMSTYSTKCTSNKKACTHLLFYSILFCSPFNHIMQLLAQEDVIKFSHYESFKIYITHLSIAKYILKLGGICSFCYINMCTLHIINI